MLNRSLMQLKDGLVVICQAPEGSPLDRVEILAAFAFTAEQNGAAGVRISGPACIAEAKKHIRIPVLGLEKVNLPGYETYITPTRESARRVAAAGCDLVALDATDRPRPPGEDLRSIIEVLRKESDVAIVADVAHVEEALAVEQLGVDAVATTLSGFTRDTRGRALPNYELVSTLACKLKIPLICEGGISTPHQVRRAFEEGAFAVCVGRALTGLDWLVQQYCAATPRITQAPTCPSDPEQQLEQQGSA